MKIGATSIVAIIGAAAWLPHFISWLYFWLVKPKLRFVPEYFTEIGYAFLGPIFNQSFAISSSRKDALVEKITATIVHESKATHKFVWKYLDEKGAELTSDKGERAEFRKHQTAVALKVSIVGLTERKINFQDVDYQNKMFSYVRAHSEKTDYLERTKKHNYQEEATQTEEFLKSLDFIKDGFYWREGKYDVYLYVYETSLKKPHTEHFRFELFKKDIERLGKNIKITQDYFKDLILYKGKPKKEWPARFWEWAYPSFNRVKT